MSDRQTPTTIIDRAHACYREAIAAGGLPPTAVVMCEADLRRMAAEMPPQMWTHKDDVLKQRRDRRSLTLSQFEDQAVEAAKAGEMFLYGMQVRLDDSAVEIRCEGATRGVKEYRGDQHAGVDNSVQAAQGCRLAAGVSDGADLCTLGTAEPTASNREIKGIAYGGSWHGEVLTSQLCRGRLMLRRPEKDGKVRMPSGGDVISQPILSEFYDVEIAGYRGRLMPAGFLEGAYFFVLKGAETPSADQVMADARAAGLTFIRTYGGG